MALLTCLLVQAAPAPTEHAHFKFGIRINIVIVFDGD